MQHQESRDRSLGKLFQRTLSADGDAQRCWQTTEGGEWRWQRDGVQLVDNGHEWSTLTWQGWADFKARGLRNFVMEVTLSGKAEAAGLSFGPFKDFLADLQSQPARRHLQLEVDAEAGCWAFRVDGQLMNRSWWDSAVERVEDLLDGTLSFKAKGAEAVLFQDLSLHTLEASCSLTVIMTCHRFLQRLRLSLRNWCHQDLPSGALEVLVVNPQSPDGTHEHLGSVARSYSHVRVCEIPVAGELATNKGAMINRAISASRGEWIWLTDADCLFGPDSAARVLAQIRGRHENLFYGERRRLSKMQTDALLSGRNDGLREFDDLARATSSQEPEQYQWGYTQIVHRSTLERVRYDENFNNFSSSDGIFAEACRLQGVLPRQIEGLFCLHLDHPFSWYGTNTFL